MMKRPNILFVLSDQLRRSALGCHGNPTIETPHLDALAARGVSFSAACATSPICVPYRFSFMTGEYAHSRLVPGIEWRMSPAERTLADEFNDHQYETVYVGKWHLYGGHGRRPFSSGKQVGQTCIPRAHQGRWKKWLGFELRNDPFDTYYFEDADPRPRRIRKFQTDGLFDLAMNHLGRRSRKPPFACVLSVEPPHFPYVAPKPLMDRWKDRPVEWPPNFGKMPPRQRREILQRLRYYYAAIENLDMNMGRLQRFLEKSGLARDTILVFTSDHGDLCGSHGLSEKQFPFEESIGVPLMVCDPSQRQSGGRVIHQPTCTEDLFPTLLGLAGLKPRDPKPGLNLAPLIRGQTRRLPREGVLLEFVAELREGMPFHDETWRGLRTDRYKYTVLGPSRGGRPWQFFDLKTDPFEQHNLLAKPEFFPLVKRHHQGLVKRLKATGDHFILGKTLTRQSVQNPPSPESGGRSDQSTVFRK